MKKLVIISTLLLSTFLTFSQVRISALPTYTGTPANTWIPVFAQGTTRKMDGASFFTSFNNVTIHYGPLVDTFLFINTYSGFSSYMLYTKSIPLNLLAGGRLIGSYPSPLLASSGVVAGTYTNCTIVVQSDGTISYASSGASGSPDSVIRTVTSNTTSLNTDKAILCNTGSGNIIVTANPSITKKVIVQKITSDFNTVTITPSSGLINGQSSLIITGAYQSVTIITDGINYYIL